MCNLNSDHNNVVKDCLSVLGGDIPDKTKTANTKTGVIDLK